MTRFEVSVTILATITVDAADMQAAIDEAARFARECGPADGFADGWNSVQPADAPTIHNVSAFDVEHITPEDVTEDEVCRADDCTESAGGGDGYDGLCASCADRAEG